MIITNNLLHNLIQSRIEFAKLATQHELSNKRFE